MMRERTCEIVEMFEGKGSLPMHTALHERREGKQPRERQTRKVSGEGPGKGRYIG